MVSKKNGSAPRPVITIRLPAEEEAYYREQAGARRMTLSAYLSKVLVQGVIAESMQDFEGRISDLVASIPASIDSQKEAVPDDIALSIFTCEALLTAIVEAQDNQVLYRAQDAARAKLKKRKGVT
jgi:hypothetical protein